MANYHLLRLEVGPDHAVGTIVDSVGLMRLRAQRWQVTDEPDNFLDTPPWPWHYTWGSRSAASGNGSGRTTRASLSRP